MRNVNKDNITDAVLASIANTPDARLKRILQALIRHLHAFAREVELTEKELMQGIEYLTATGHKCTGTRQEFILLSDVLGLSMLTVAMNNDNPAACTEATVFGPFFVEGAPEVANGGDVAQGAPGTPCEVHCTLKGLNGEAIAGAHIDVWQSDSDGSYDVQKENLAHAQGRAKLQSQPDGSFWFHSVVPEAYSIPTDGPVGQLLNATERSPWRPAHLHFRIRAQGYRTLVTHIFRDGDQYLDSDAVFGVRQSLIKKIEKTPAGTYKLSYDFVLNPVHDPR